MVTYASSYVISCVCFEHYINPNLSFQHFWGDKPRKAKGCNVLFKIETLLKINV